MIKEHLTTKQNATALVIIIRFILEDFWLLQIISHVSYHRTLNNSWFMSNEYAYACDNEICLCCSMGSYEILDKQHEYCIGNGTIFMRLSQVRFQFPIQEK